MRQSESLRLTACAAKSFGTGLRLNRTGGITEYLQSPYATALTNVASQGSFQMWFTLAAVGATQCVYTSVDTSFRCAFVEVTASNELWAYYTGNTGGTAAQVQLATGITANTLYHLVHVYVGANNYRVYVNGALVATLTTVLGLFHNNIVVGARKYANAGTPPTSPSQLVGANSNGYFNHANMTVFGLGFTSSALSANQVSVLWNSGKGMMPERKRLVGVTWHNFFRLAASKLSGSAFTGVFGSAALTLTQSTFQTLSYQNRLGSLVY
jgi:hypothetical protein